MVGSVGREGRLPIRVHDRPTEWTTSSFRHVQPLRSAAQELQEGTHQGRASRASTFRATTGGSTSCSSRRALERPRSRGTSEGSTRPRRRAAMLRAGALNSTPSTRNTRARYIIYMYSIESSAAGRRRRAGPCVAYMRAARARAARAGAWKILWTTATVL